MIKNYQQRDLLPGLECNQPSFLKYYYLFLMNIDSIAYWNRVIAIASELPGAEISTSYGTPAFKVNKKLFTRLKEDGKTLVVYSEERDKWMKKAPGTFFITNHYKNYPSFLVDLESVKTRDLEELLFKAWQLRAPKRLLKPKN